MSDTLQHTTQQANPTIGWAITFVCGAMGVFILSKVISIFSVKRDRKRIHAYMRTQIPKAHTYLSTKNIASNTNLSPQRVEDVCHNFDKVKYSTGEKDDRWGLREYSD